MHLDLSPLKKHPNPEEINEGSSLSLYKNGQLMLVCRDLKQVFYCFGVSLFNYSQMEMIEKKKGVEYMPEGSSHYMEVLSQKIPYHDLEALK